MLPVIFQIGSFKLPAYGLLVALGYLAAIFYLFRKSQSRGFKKEDVADLVFYSVLSGMAGAKLFYAATYWDQFGPDFLSRAGYVLRTFQYGFVFYGGLIGGILTAWWYARRHRLPGWPTADVLAPGVVLGQAIGRLGCFAAGCCWGKITAVPWAVVFTDVYASRQVGTPMDAPLHPSQIYESAAAFLIFLLLLWLAPRKRFHGQVALAYVLLYSAVRFALEFLRGDPDRGSWFRGALSTSQLIAIGLVLGAALLLPRVRRTQAIPRA